MFTATYLRFRLLQLLRIFQQIGIFRAIILISVICLLVATLYKFVEKYYLPILFFIVSYGIHNSRSDKKLLSVLSQNSYTIYWIEYTLLSLFFVTLSIIKGFYADLLFYPFAILIIPLLRNMKIRNKTWSVPFFRKGSYEYQMMFRKSFLLLFVLYIISFLGLYNNNERIFYFGCFVSSVIWFLALIKPEPLVYILNYSNSKSLIQNKISNILFNTFILFVPFLLISPLGGWSVIGTTAFLCANSICTTIGINMLKYSFSRNEFLVTLLTLLVLVPLSIMSIIYPVFIIFNSILNLFLIFRASDKLDSFFDYDSDTTFE